MIKGFRSKRDIGDVERNHIIVVGANGFLGTHVVRKFLKYGYKVTAVDLETVSLDSLRKLYARRLDLVRGDILNNIRVEIDPEASVYVVHLAAIANPRVCNSNPELAFNVNVLGLKNILRLFKNCKKFVFASSIMVYGHQPNIPIREDIPPAPNDIYSTLKLMGEYTCKMFNYSFGTPYLILRLSNSYGPGQTGDYLIPSLISQALQKGVIELWDPRPIRDFVYVEDTAEAIVEATLSQTLINEVINVGSGRGVSTLELANLISKLTNSRVVDINKRQDVSLRLVPDITKLTTLTGWKPRVELKDGLMRTIKFYKAHQAEVTSQKYD